MLVETGCDLVMVGRGALGRPWVFGQINRTLECGGLFEEPSVPERIRICVAHYRQAIRLSGERRGVLEMRKHIGWYLKGLPDGAVLRQELFRLTDPFAVEAKLLLFAQKYPGASQPLGR
jgi:tRNA-dihydrouridine synthase